MRESAGKYVYLRGSVIAKDYSDLTNNIIFESPVVNTATATVPCTTLHVELGTEKLVPLGTDFSKLILTGCKTGFCARQTSPFALISDRVYTLGAVARNCAAYRPASTTATTPNPSLARRRELPPRFPHAAPCALDNI
jgi:hypothetical protein